MFNPIVLDPVSKIPKCMAFSSKQMTIAIILGHDVKLFSLVDGSLLHDFKDIGRRANQICFDANETKFVLSYENGEIRAHSTETGRHLSSADLRCKREITSMLSDAKTYTIVTTSCNGSLSVYDTLEDKNKITCMRVVRECGEITCLALSRDLNMIATGDSKGRIRLWSYATMNARNDRLPRLVDPVLSLTFIDPYPLLLSSDTSGRIFVWCVKSKATKCMGVLNLIHNSTTSSSNFLASAVVDMRVVFEQKGGSEICPGIQTGAHLLVMSDSQGFVTVLTLNSIIKTLGLRVVSTESTKRSRYRVDRNANHLDSEVETVRHQNVKKLDVKIVSKWRAHSTEVKQMCVLRDPKCVVTMSSKSENIKIWSFGHTSSMCGLVLGELDTVHNRVVSKKWSVPVRKRVLLIYEHK